MERARVWPDFQDTWIVHQDEDVIVVDKPAGMPSQAAEASRDDDLVTRLRRHLQSRGEHGYLGVHQRLDQETSGLVLLTRRREANGSVARQFEERHVDKKYAAAASGWALGKQRAELRDLLAPGRDGRMAVVRARGQQAVTAVRVVERQGARALLELELRTGRTHQARVQLAHAGAPIAGDALYGGELAPRLCLHAAELSLVHPRTGRKVTYRAPVPAEIVTFVKHGDPGVHVYDDVTTMERALDRAVMRRYALAHSTGERATTAFRLVHAEGEGLPGLAVDVYGEHLLVHLFEGQGPWDQPAHVDRVLDMLMRRLAPRGIYLKTRPRQANTLVDAHRAGLAPREPVRGEPSALELEIREEGVSYRARLGDGMSTGIFLDQRHNRARVRDLAAGKRVLNLFAYTCAFTVAAATGGARSTVSVDAAAVALERGREALAAAGLLERGEHRFVAEDAFAWLARAARRGERYDLVLLDPPSYATVGKKRFVAATDYGSLVAATLAVVAPGGYLLASLNHRGTSRARLRRAVASGAREASVELAQLKDLPDPSDFIAPPGGEVAMKSVLARVAEVGVGRRSAPKSRSRPRL